MTQTVPDISPLMPMHQDPLLVNNPVKTFLWMHLHQCQYLYNVYNSLFIKHASRLTGAKPHQVALAETFAWMLCSLRDSPNKKIMLHSDGVLFECKYVIMFNKINNLCNGSAMIKICQKHLAWTTRPYVLSATHDVALSMATGNQLRASIVPT